MVNVESAKQIFFTNLGLTLRGAFVVHKLPLSPTDNQSRAGGGLWERNEKGIKEWRNVSEHCLVEAARVEVLAELLGLPGTFRKTLMLSATLHDYYKKGYVEKITKTTNIKDATEKSEKESKERLEALKFPEEVLEILEILEDRNIAVALQTAQTIKQKGNFKEIDLQKLILRYVDDYTIGSDWVNPVVVGKQPTNDLDRRVDENENIPAYKKNSEAWRSSFNGESFHELQRRTGHFIEQLLTELINSSQNLNIQPIDLPYFVDEKIKQKIKKLSG